MQTVSMDVAIHDAMRSVSKVERLAPGTAAPSFVGRAIFNFTSFLFTRWIRRSNVGIADGCSRLRMYALTVSQSEDKDVIDPDLHIREHLEQLKASAHRSRATLLKLQESIKNLGAENSQMAKDVKTMVGLHTEMYEAANQLQWEIAEHDASFSANHEGFTAASRSDLDAMLDRIASGG